MYLTKANSMLNSVFFVLVTISINFVKIQKNVMAVCPCNIFKCKAQHIDACNDVTVLVCKLVYAICKLQPPTISIHLLNKSRDYVREFINTKCLYQFQVLSTHKREHLFDLKYLIQQVRTIMIVSLLYIKINDIALNQRGSVNCDHFSFMLYAEMNIFSTVCLYFLLQRST